ncbi:MAG: hypothetical protein HQ534_04065 [Armatimonadetes bacterium]|nr:hypothetical protein [Armatimonadota bacterium]
MIEEIKKYQKESCKDCAEFKGIRKISLGRTERVCNTFGGVLTSSFDPVKQNCFMPKENIEEQIEKEIKIEKSKMPLVIKSNIISGIIGGVTAGIIVGIALYFILGS